ncbi:choice-of-anchor J domain-containing protein [Roseateles sp.]|uniref:choice-of-anchor J family PEP-CTERM protein n=1 Tax=Roseateles sp. TaxID=1971397 RepID=UPI0031DE9269
MFKKTCLALALLGAAAAAQAGPTLLDEGFDNVDTLAGAGWIRSNQGSGGGLTDPWVQGDQSIFTALSGAPNAYVASNFNNAAAGGTLSSWLISPVFSTAENLEVSFWARGDIQPGYIDQLAYGLVDAAGIFSSFVPQATITAQGDWTRYSFLLGGQGAGATARFAIQYIGSADQANYVGVDNVAVNVPEPSSWALAGISLLGLAAARRRRAQR